MATFPGFHADFDISRYPRSLHPAIRKIGSDFYLTRSLKPVEIGNSEYYAVLARPTDEFSVYVNTDRELVVLFSQYETFEIRTLEAYDEFYSQFDSSRLDKSLRFLISGDHKIESTIRHYLDQHPEYPIIIPIHIDILSSGTKNPLLDAVRRNYLLRDLFKFQNPLREETFFFGRQLIVNSVLDMAKSGQNSSLFGLRKSGKTSAIYAIQRKAKGFSCNVAVIDCQGLAVHARRYNSLLGYVIAEIRRSIGQKKLSIDLGNDPVEVAEKFNMHMNNTLSSAKNTTLLIFDEIENISPGTAASPHWNEGPDTLYFWQTIRSYLQSDAKARLSLCIVGTSPRILEITHINSVANPIYLFAQKQFIPNLTFDETREMVERLGYFMGLEFPVEVISELHRQFGGHPFFTRQVCSEIHQKAPAKRPFCVSRPALERATTAFQGQLETYFSGIIEHLEKDYPGEFAILKSVILGNKVDLDYYSKEGPELIDHLIGYGLVSHIENDYDIRLDAIKCVLRRLIKVDDEEYWGEISKRRNAVETDIRLALFHWSKGISPSQWNDFLTKNLTKTRYQALTTIEPNVLFSRKESPLYLTDLLALLKDNEVLPFLTDRRSHIVKFLDIINKLRKDAHAIMVTETDISSARAAFDYIEAEFSVP